jgi:hypothetical protein
MRTLDPERESLLELLDELRFTTFRLRRSSAAAALLPAWENLLKDVRSAFDVEWNLLEKLIDAAAGVDMADGGLDVVVLRVVNTLVKTVDGDRSHPFYQRYLGGQSPSDLVRPRLGDELVKVGPWVDSLKAAPQLELQDLAKPLGDAVDAGKLEAEAAIKAKRLYDDFRVGPRRELFEKVNGERSKLFGELRLLEAADRGKTLPRDFAERHFKPRRRKPGAFESVAAAKIAVDEAAAQFEEAKTRLKALEAEAEAERQADAQREADLKALAEAERQAEEARARAAELAKRLGR